MLSQITSVWRSALQVKGFRNKFIIAAILLASCAIIAPNLFQYVQQREGQLLNDYLLSRLPAYELSSWIFILLYILIFISICSLLLNPRQFLVVLQAYIILTFLRFVAILLVPLEPPTLMIELHDPFVQYLFYQQSVTKDLFFSGHTSLLVLLAMAVTSTWLRSILVIGAFAVATMLLIQHAHYTIDIVLAPFFSWFALALAKKIPEKEYRTT
jgi:hypothetical protein